MIDLIERWESQAQTWDAWAAKCGDTETIKYIWTERAGTLRACTQDLREQLEREQCNQSQ